MDWHWGITWKGIGSSEQDRGWNSIAIAKTKYGKCGKIRKCVAKGPTGVKKRQPEIQKARHYVRCYLTIFLDPRGPADAPPPPPPSCAQAGEGGVQLDDPPLPLEMTEENFHPFSTIS